MCARGSSLTDINKILDLTAEQIGTLTRKAFKDLLKRISDGQDPRDAISSIMQGFDPAYREVLAKSFTKALGDFVGADELVSYPVGEVSLSQALYQHAREISAAVRQIVFEHAAGWQDARKLALDIYEGYGFRGGDDPLQWPKGSDKWPKYMQRAVVTDPASYRGWLNVARQGVSSIKTPALKAAYTELLDAVENGAGEKALTRKLDVAFQEQMRFRANRIAQTELHRQWMDKQAAEIMGDETISVVQFRMADSHPKTDICDCFAKQDKYGLGPGLYPKAKAPKPPLHPFCRCRWVSKRLLSADNAREDPDAERKYLRAMAEREGVSKAARVIGSKDKLLRVLNKKASVEEVFNQYRPVPYQLGRMGGVLADNRGMDIESFARRALTVADSKIEISLGTVTNAERIKAETGFDVSGFERIIDNYGIRHTIKRHGNEAIESARGQIAVTLADFDLVPLITASPDLVFADGKNKIGRDVIVFTKLIDGIGYRHVEEIRPKGKLVATDSLRKKKGAWGS